MHASNPSPRRKHRRRSAVASTLLILATGAACRSTPAAPPPAPAVSADTWAVVDGHAITQADVDSAYKRAGDTAQGLSDDEALTAKLGLLENLIMQEILLAKARALNLTVADSEVETAYNDAKKPDMAIRECNNALKRNPKDGETYYYLARAYDLTNKTDEATKYYKQAVVGLLEQTKNNPDSADGFYLLGNAYRADNQLDKAISAYMKCLELSPRFVRARYNIGIIQLRQKNKTAALEQYNRLLTLDPELAGKLKAEIDKS